jgi:hypothetical protein
MEGVRRTGEKRQDNTNMEVLDFLLCHGETIVA